MKILLNTTEPVAPSILRMSALNVVVRPGDQVTIFISAQASTQWGLP